MRMIARIYLFGIAAAAVLIASLGAVGPAEAQIGSSAVVEGPIYNPQTKSYIELRHSNDDLRWGEASRVAGHLSYKGVQGRLAVVRSIEAHEFLLRFPLPREGWIGLRFDCASRQLVWSDGRELSADGFNAWNLTRWHRTKITCSHNDISHMGVYYQSRQDFRWQAAGQAKVFHYFFVEYPTGQP